MRDDALTAAEPWYRQRWPWLLMAGPAVVIVAGFVTLWLAVRSDDGLVADDYYKQGIAINRTLARGERAQALGLAARIAVHERKVELRLAGGPGTVLPPRVRLTLSHPTHGGQDQTVLLSGREGVYAGSLAREATGHWRIIVEDEAATWRLAGAAVLSGSGVSIEPQESGGQSRR